MRKKMTRDDWKALIKRERIKFDKWDGSLCMVNVSGGLASSVAWKRCLDKFGKDRVHPVFADTQSEDEDTYRFLNDCERAFGQKLTRLVSPIGNIWDVFDEFGVITVANGRASYPAEFPIGFNYSKHKRIDGEEKKNYEKSDHHPRSSA